MEEHPNYTRQKSEARARMLERAHLEADAERIRRGIADLLAGTGFELDIDRWGTGGIVLRHFPNTEVNTFRYDLEIDLETGRQL